MNPPVRPKPPSQAKDIPSLAYRIEDAAIALGVGRTLVYRMISEGQLTAVKVGKRSLIAVSELDAFLARGGSK